MSRTDITPFRDPRNAVGLLTDVLDMTLRGPMLALAGTPPTDPAGLNPVVLARDIGREFTKAPRTVLNGYKRKGSSDLYQRAKYANEKLPEDLWGWDARKRELHSTLRDIGGRGLRIIMDVMEDLDRWTKFTKPTTQRRYGTVETIQPEWPRAWSSHVQEALKLGANHAAILNTEVAWHWRDLTERSHRGKNIKAAFEAAWLAGEYKFAQQLIDQEFP